MFDMLIRGVRGTCGGDKKIALHEGITCFNLKRSGRWHSDSNTKKLAFQVFHVASLPHPSLLHGRLEVVFLLARFKSRLSSKPGDKTL